MRRCLQLLQQQVTDLNTRAELIKAVHIEALKEADERSRTLERTKAESDRSLKAEINRLSRQLAIRESSNTPMSAMRIETILTGKRNPKRFNDTHKKFQLALNVYLGTTYYKEEKNLGHVAQPLL